MLPAVLVVTVLLALAAYQYSELMVSEYRAADSARRSAQARSLADSGVYYAAALLSNQDAFTNTLNSNPFENPAAFSGILVQDNDQSRRQGRFSVFAPLDPDDSSATNSQPFRYGVIDEAGRINLNALMKLDSSGRQAHDILMKLPNMTEDIANAILDWLDPDDEPRTNGAENQYYSSLSPPYRCKNGPLDSLDELLLVRGVTPQLLYGNDRNRNGILDPDENDGTGGVDRGWSAYLTVYSREQNVDASGNARIYVNKSDLNQLHQDLTDAVGEELATYIIAYRLYGQSTPSSNPSGSNQQGGGSSGNSQGGGQSGGSTPAAGSGARGAATAGGAARGAAAGGAATAGGAARGAAAGGASRTSGGGGAAASSSRGTTQPAQPLTFDMLDTRGRQPRSISSLYELINSEVSITSNSQAIAGSATVGSGGQMMVRLAISNRSTTSRYPSPLRDPSKLRQLLPVLLDKATTRRDAEIPGRVNINTAPRAVLAALPGLTDADVQTILSQRPSPSASEPPDEIYKTPAWLITEAHMSPDTLRTLERYITARTQVYRVQVLGQFDGGGPTARVEAVIDTNLGRPRIVYFRDLTELGKGFDVQ